MTTRSAPFLLCALLAACAGGRTDPTAAAESAPLLAGTAWQLVEFRSNDDDIGTVRPTDRSLYTLKLEPDGRAAMRLNCNVGSGTWSATPADGDSGEFAFGPVGMTKVYCQPPSLDQQIARDAQYVRTYLRRDGRLYLDLMADGGTYVWEPAQTSR